MKSSSSVKSCSSVKSSSSVKSCSSVKSSSSASRDSGTSTSSKADTAKPSSAKKSRSSMRKDLLVKNNSLEAESRKKEAQKDCAPLVPVVHGPRVNELAEFVVNKLIANGTFAEAVAKIKRKVRLSDFGSLQHAPANVAKLCLNEAGLPMPFFDDVQLLHQHQVISFFAQQYYRDWVARFGPLQRSIAANAAQIVESDGRTTAAAEVFEIADDEIDAFLKQG